MSFTALAGLLETSATLVLTAALKGAPLIAIALVATYLLRHRSAATRHAIWASALLGQLVLLLALPFVPPVNVPILPSVEWSGASAPAQVPEAARVETATEPGALATDVTARRAMNEGAADATVSAMEPGSSMPSLFTILIVVWLFGALVVFGRYVAGTARVARLARQSERVADGNWLSLMHRMAISMGIARPLTLVRGAQLDIPVTWGILYPVVFLPADSEDWAEERQRFVLVHELAHVKRMDAATQLLTQIAVAVFWFNPLVWYAALRIRAERERACDDHVLLHGVRPSLYADELLGMVRGMAPRRRDPAPAFAALAMARRSEFEGRMLAILDPNARRASLSRGVRFATMAAALLLLLPLAAFRPVSATNASRQAAAVAAIATDGADEDRLAVAGSQPALELPTIAGTETTTAGAVMPGDPAAATTVASGSIPAPESQRYRCTQADLRATGQNISIHGHTDDKSGASYSEATIRTPRRCVYAIVTGDVTFTRDLSDIASIAPGARAFLQEFTPGLTRELIVTLASDGSIDRKYTEDGTVPAAIAGLTAAARANRWLSELLRELVLSGGFQSAERARQLRASDGLDAALREASQSPSSSVKRKYFDALLKSKPQLSEAESDRVLRQAAAEVTSSTDLRAVALAAIRNASPSPEALAAATARISSDTDRRAVIIGALRNGRDAVNAAGAPPDAGTMRSLLRSTASISSSTDKRAVLVEAAPYAFTSDAMRAEFYNAVAAVSSSTDRRAVLATAVRHTPKDIGATREFLSAAEGVSSSTDRSAVLIAGINGGLVTTDAARQEFTKAADALPSDSDRSRVMRALLR